ncbi:hypothetical protein [Candidatus Blastococcus massiliensis]|uniref:hypothetical protein n=1 Tax=Candidatus Blastococcus massiliensis TaxID=1470358 RepID=UPI0004B662D7|nr:hypothetical protein [Candidatus Blastococcus massiliensis]
MLRRMDGSRLVALVLAVVLAAAVVTWLAMRNSGADDTAAGSSGLPSCADLAGTDLGPLDEDPAWNGCVTEGGAAVRSYRYECSGLRRVTYPDGDERRLAAEAAVVFLPDAGLTAATGQPWVEVHGVRAAHLPTPFVMLGPYRCDELRSLPHGGSSPASCALDDVPLELSTTQGCSREGQYYAAVGRTCIYPDWDIGVLWEQWSIDVPGLGGPDDPTVLESGPDEEWWMVPGQYRDERCSTPPPGVGRGLALS